MKTKSKRKKVSQEASNLVCEICGRKFIYGVDDVYGFVNLGFYTEVPFLELGYIVYSLDNACAICAQNIRNYMRGNIENKI